MKANRFAKQTCGINFRQQSGREVKACRWRSHGCRIIPGERCLVSFPVTGISGATSGDIGRQRHGAVRVERLFQRGARLRK